MRALDDAQKNGRIPTPKEINKYDKNDKIAAEMGLTDKQYQNIAADRLPDVLNAHDKLKAEGALKKPDSEPNPYIQEYIETYKGAVKRLFVEDTTTRRDAKEEPVPETPVIKRSTEEVIARQTDDEHKNQSKYQLNSAMRKAVSEHLGVTDDQAFSMQFGKPEEKAKFFEALEIQLKQGNIKGEMDRTKTETEAILKKSMNVSDEEFTIMKKEDPDRVSLAYGILHQNGVMSVPYNNPHLNAEVGEEIKMYHREVERKRLLAEQAIEAEATESQEDEELKNEEPDNEEPGTQPESTEPDKLSARGSYDYLASTRPNTGNGIPKIDLNAESGPQIRMGTLKPGEYFAMQADPVLAQQQIQMKQAPATDTEQKMAAQERRPDTLRI